MCVCVCVCVCIAAGLACCRRHCVLASLWCQPVVPAPPASAGDIGTCCDSRTIHSSPYLFLSLCLFICSLDWSRLKLKDIHIFIVCKVLLEYINDAYVYNFYMQCNCKCTVFNCILSFHDKTTLSMIYDIFRCKGVIHCREHSHFMCGRAKCTKEAYTT